MWEKAAAMNWSWSTHAGYWPAVLKLHLLVKNSLFTPSETKCQIKHYKNWNNLKI